MNIFGDLKESDASGADTYSTELELNSFLVHADLPLRIDGRVHCTFYTLSECEGVSPHESSSSLRSSTEITLERIEGELA